MSDIYDAVVVGGGHNGLVSAAYLAKNGLKVIVFERRPIVGGACVTEEFFPGFRISSLSYVAGLLRPEIIADLELARFGLELRATEAQKFRPFPNGRYLFLWKDEKMTAKEIEKFSKKDAKNYVKYLSLWKKFRELVHPTLLSPPVSLNAMSELLDNSECGELLQMLLLMSAERFLAEFFESDEVKSVLCIPSIYGLNGGPMSPGSAYILAHHSLAQIPGEGDGNVWGFARGGMGAISNALARAARNFGATIVTSTEVSSIIVKSGRAVGVRLENQREIVSRAVISNADPKRTFLRLVTSDFLEKRFVAKVKRLQTAGVSMKINCALQELPDFKAHPGKRVGPQHQCSADICPSIDYLERAWDDAKYGSPSKEPYIDLWIQSALGDSTFAPRGKHSLSIYVQYTPYNLKSDSWDDIKEDYANGVVNKISEYAPNFRKSIIHRQTLTPLDMERTYYLPQGNAFHIDMTSDQILSSRPILGWSDYATPIENLYLCGAGTHPGGGVTGAPGHNAAQVVMQKLRGKIQGR